MNPIESREPVFPLGGDSSLPRTLRAPRLEARPVDAAFAGGIYPGAWSARHVPLRHRRTNALLVEDSTGADALRSFFGEDGCIYSGPASHGMPIIVV